MTGRENDTALWLHNKLGSTDDLWSGRSICSQITKERLHDIIGCFRSLQPHVKVKLLLSFLHIVKRNVDEWKVDLGEIIELAVDDRDQWVSTIGEILKTFPATFLVNTTDLTGSTAFHSMYTELKKTVRRSGESTSLPLEYVCLGKVALSAAIPQTPPSNDHFTLKVEPKSTALRTELLTKSEDLHTSTKKKGVPIGSVPMKSRSTAKRMDEEISAASNQGSIQRNGGSNTGFLKANTLSSYSSAQRNSSSLSMRKEGGAKMLDISEMPPTGKEAKRRKKIEEQEAAAQAKKEKEEAAAAEKSASAAQATPDYAAGLGAPTAIKSVMPRAPKPKAAAATTPSYLPNISPRLPSMAYGRELGGPLSASTIQSHAPRPVQHTVPAQPTQTVRIRAPTANYQPRPTVQQPILRTPVVQQPTATQPPAAAAQIVTAVPQAAKKPLSLTKEQMVEAQEMFKNSNKVTRPEKALILGFMAGSRENPCPQQGHIVNIRLSERVEPVRLQDNSIRDMVSETFFQMNYQTGDWRRIKKFKETPQIVL